VIVAHIMGLPIEESVLQLAPAGAATVTAVAFTARAALDRLRRRGSSATPPDLRDDPDRVAASPALVDGGRDARRVQVGDRTEHLV